MIANVSYDTVLVALIAAVVGPSVLFLQAERRHRQERAEAKADAVEAREQSKKDAAEAKVAVEQVALQAAEAARLLLESNKRVASRSDVIAAKIDENATKLARIETNTDGALTKAMKGTLAAVETGLASLRALAAERAERGQLVTDETLTALTAGEAEATSLRHEINLRITTIPHAGEVNPAFTPPRGIPATSGDPTPINVETATIVVSKEKEKP